jgi:CheY-like chemotaxis protein
MKKIILARSIVHSMGNQESIFGRGNIVSYVAQTSEEIMNIHGVRKADMIITEDSLPLMGAARLCSLLRNDVLLKNVSIVVACDKADESEAQWREAGANAVISKPVDSLTLFSKISELLVIPQRKDLRVSLSASVKSREHNGSFSGDSHNISMSGMLLETDHVLELGDRLTCSFSIAHSDVSAECVVMRVDAAKAGKRRYGVKFLNCDTKALIIIDHYVKSQMKQ